MGKEVKKKDQSELVDRSMFEGQPTGFEGTDSQTFKTPFLKILQGLSPELSPSNAKHIPGAQIGKFCNSATQQLYDSINVVVLRIDHTLVVWKPDRGGFVGRYPKSQEKEIVHGQEGVQKWDADMNEVIDTIEFYCINIDDPSDIFIFPLSTASLKHAKAWATRIRLLKADGKPIPVSWAGVWNISTMEETNDKGTWSTLGATPDFSRFVTMEEKDNFIIPAIEMLKTAETDYNVMVEDSEEDDVDSEY